MAPRAPIGIFDSGIGGLTVANAIVNILPHETLFYFGDTAHVPYGGKSAETVVKYSHDIVSFLLDQGCKAIVVACNTASAAALASLRHNWPSIPIIGMEPAVKPASSATQTGVVGILATRGTFSSERYANLVDRFGHGITVLENPCIGLVELIEAGLVDDAITENFLHQILTPMLDKGADTFVLGCTHYPLVRPLIERIIPPSATIIDPAPAVARQLQRRLQHLSLLSDQRTDDHHFFVSGDPHAFHTMAKRFFLADFLLEQHLIY
ncbi:MAG: glutamate racemase [Saprospiraceae bacterium]|nr:glutamate racemase [Saprospiraceae bacterium]